MGCGHRQELEEKEKNDHKPKREVVNDNLYSEDEAAVPGNKTVKDSFQARNLRIENIIGADIDIQVHDLPIIDISITGPEALVKKFQMGQESVTWAYLMGKSNDNTGDITFNNGNMTINGVRVSGNSINFGSSISFGKMPAGNIFIGANTIITGNGESEVKVTVKVPVGAELNITDTVGITTIGDTEGNLTVHNSLSGDINVGKVKDTSISISGSSDILINEMNGDLTVIISGSGNVRVKHGTVRSLVAGISGSGDIKFHGKARTANLSVSGNGDIYVHHVEQRPSRSVTGSGDIEVGNW